MRKSSEQPIPNLDDQATEDRIRELEHQVEILQKDYQALTDQSRMLDHIHDAIFGVDKHFVITYWNKAAEQLYGWKSSEVLGKPLGDVLHHCQANTGHEQILRSLEQDGKVQMEAFHVHKDGSRLAVDVIAIAVRDENATIQGYVAAGRDTTRRWEMMNDLQLEQSRMRALLDQTPAGVVITDSSGNIILTNQSAREIFGGQITGSVYGPSEKYTFFHHKQEDIEPDDLPLPRAINQGITSRNVELLVRLESGEEKNVLASAAPLFNHQGEIIGSMAVINDITERRQAEEERERLLSQVRASARDARLWAVQTEAVFNSLTDAVIVFDNDWKIKQSNGYAIAMLGFDPYRMDAETIFQRLSLQDSNGRPLTADALPFSSTLEGKTDVNRKLHLTNRKGHVYIVQASALPLYVGSALSGAVLIFRDITINERLMEENRRLADAMPQLVWTARPDGSLDYMNRRSAEFEGISRSPDGTWQWERTIHPDDLPNTRAKWEEALRTGSTFQVEHRGWLKNGGFRWLLSRAVPVYDEQGHVVKWYGTTTDIHDQKLVEEALRRSENRLRRLVESNIIGVVYRSEDGKIFWANDAFLQMVGYSREELDAGKLSWKEITPDEYLPQDFRGTAEAKARGFCQPYEKEYIRRDGTLVPVIIGYAAMDESSTDFIAFVLDLTDLKKAKASVEEYARKLESSNKELEQFAFVASHDLQEPLRKIRSFGVLLQEKKDLELDEEARSYLTRMIDAANRMSMMTLDLLQLSRVSTRGQEFVPVDMERTVEEVLSDLEVRIRKTGGVVQVGAMPVIEADPLQMHQLIMNLVGNALKFHKKDTSPIVTVTCERIPKGRKEPEQVVLTVEDNGIGFDEMHLERIFQPFQRLHGRSQYEGNGMGLAICKKIVERHHGAITAHSRPGRGAQFRVLLPVNQTTESE